MSIEVLGSRAKIQYGFRAKNAENNGTEHPISFWICNHHNHHSVHLQFILYIERLHPVNREIFLSKARRALACEHFVVTVNCHQIELSTNVFNYIFIAENVSLNRVEVAIIALRLKGVA